MFSEILSSEGTALEGKEGSRPLGLCSGLSSDSHLNKWFCHTPFSQFSSSSLIKRFGQREFDSEGARMFFIFVFQSLFHKEGIYLLNEGV